MSMPTSLYGQGGVRSGKGGVGLNEISKSNGWHPGAEGMMFLGLACAVEEDEMMWSLESNV